MCAFQRISGAPAPCGTVGASFSAAWKDWRRAARASGVLATLVLACLAGAATAVTAQGRTNLPPKVIQAQRFLAQRGWQPGRRRLASLATGESSRAAGLHSEAVRPQAQAQTAAAATWTALGPTAVLTPNYGPVTGRVSALALDPTDSTGNCLYLGTTGGGVWRAQNAGTASASSIVFTPLTDSVAALSGAEDASISIGALTVQPGTVSNCGAGSSGGGVILAGTGDPNDALDSYYGAGILRSTDGGNTWSLIATTSDFEQNLSKFDFSFAGEGFAGFAWSTVNTQLVVAAVSQAFEGTLVDAVLPGESYEGLYYSSDAGASWHIATITDEEGADVQGPSDAFADPDGNAATSVVWNPVRQLFIAAVRYHGYYQSADGVTWTRLAAQPGSGLSAAFCPTNTGATGSIACPIFRGTLAVNPLTGDTFAWTVDASNQDRGIWQDQCAMSGGACTNRLISFQQQWNSASLETSTIYGPATIANGDYNLALAAVPNGQETTLLAGANDLWKTNCPLAQGCQWRNTTNSTVGFCAQVGEFQHALAWNTANPMEVFVGNDSGLWRSMDGIGEMGQVCAVSDATHFQNLNGSLGSLAEVVSISAVQSTPYTMMAGLGVNGTAGATGASGPTADWPQILGGEGGPVVIDSRNNLNWYVNNEPGVSIYLCNVTLPCTPASFGSAPVVTDADVGGDGYTMTLPAPFLVDPLDEKQLLIGTCRVWRGPASGIGWSAGNAVSSILDNSASTGSCNGDALIRSMAAVELPISQAHPGGGEVVFVGMYGSADGGSLLPGRVFSGTYDAAAGSWSAWRDLSLNPVTNDNHAMNAYGLDISSIFIDTHDASGNTIYVTVDGARTNYEIVRSVYSSTDGGAHWAQLTSNLPDAPVNSLAVDPQDANTVYLATDEGVYFTTQIATCANAASTCWAIFGSGLPAAPAVQLSASSPNSQAQVLVAATYGRGIWQTPLWTASTGLTTASVSPSNPVVFAETVAVGMSASLTVIVTNTGSFPFTSTASPAMSAGDFSVTTDNCAHATEQPGGSCTLAVTFAPTLTGTRTAQLTIFGNVYGGQLQTVELSGTGTPASVVTVSPASISFDPAPGQSSSSPPVVVGTTSGLFPVGVQNAGNAAVSITGLTITPPFAIASNSCGTSALQPQSYCQIQLDFAPTQQGAATGTLTLTDSAGTQTVSLSGYGWAAAADSTLPSALPSFGGVAVGQLSPAQTLPLMNTGEMILTGIAIKASGPFTESDTCGTQLPGGASCAISVIFAPTQLGSQTGTLTVADALRTQTVALSGTGVQPAAIGVSPSSLNFAAQQVGAAGSSLALTVTNTGGAPMANVGFQITGQAAGSFSIGTTTCGATLASGASCAVQVIFSPAATGGSAATLTVTSSTSGVAPVTVALNGTGQVWSGLNVSPAQLTFAVTAVGQTSAAQTVTVTNTSNASFAAPAFAPTAQFSVTQNTCNASLAAGASCTAGVVFQPSAVGAASGTLGVSSASVATPATVLLSGTGAVGAAIQVSPTAIVFATTAPNAIGSPTTVTVTNTGMSASLTSMALAVSAGFQIVNNTCPASLAPGQSCTAGIEFAPTSAGAQTGSLTVTSSAAATASVPLSGMSLDFTLTVVGSSSQTVAAGQTASYTLAITPLNGSGGTFTFACGTLPANALCLFNPATETLNGATGNVKVEISTTKSTAQLEYPPAWRVLPLICGLVLLPFGWRRRRKILLLAALLLVLAGGVSSCTSSGGGSGGSGGQGGSSGTPAGTYSIPVSAAAAGVQHSVTLTLTVD